MRPSQILTIALFLSAVLCGQAQETGSVQVATLAPNNRTVAVYYRVPDKNSVPPSLRGEWFLSADFTDLHRFFVIAEAATQRLFCHKKH